MTTTTKAQVAKHRTLVLTATSDIDGTTSTVITSWCARGRGTKQKCPTLEATQQMMINDGSSTACPGASCNDAVRTCVNLLRTRLPKKGSCASTARPALMPASSLGARMQGSRDRSQQSFSMKASVDTTAQHCSRNDPHHSILIQTPSCKPHSE